MDPKGKPNGRIVHLLIQWGIIIATGGVVGWQTVAGDQAVLDRKVGELEKAVAEIQGNRFTAMDARLVDRRIAAVEVLVASSWSDPPEWFRQFSERVDKRLDRIEEKLDRRTP